MIFLAVYNYHRTCNRPSEFLTHRWSDRLSTCNLKKRKNTRFSWNLSKIVSSYQFFRPIPFRLILDRKIRIWWGFHLAFAKLSHPVSLGWSDLFLIRSEMKYIEPSRGDIFMMPCFLSTIADTCSYLSLKYLYMSTSKLARLQQSKFPHSSFSIRTFSGTLQLITTSKLFVHHKPWWLTVR